MFGDVYLEVISAYVTLVQKAKDATVDKEGTFSGIGPWSTPTLRGQGEKKEQAKEIGKRDKLDRKQAMREWCLGSHMNKLFPGRERVD